MNEKFILKCILVVILIILIIMGVIKLYENGENGENEEEILSTQEENVTIESNGKFDKIYDKVDYYAIKSIIEKYITYTKYVNGDIYIENNTSEQIKEEGIKAIMKMLDSDYIDCMEITNSTIENHAMKFTKTGNYMENVDYTLIIEDLSVYEISSVVQLYLVELQINGNSSNILIKLDLTNNTFSLFLSDYIEQYNYTEEMSSNDIDIEDSEITTNNYNTFTYSAVSTEYMAREYFEMYKLIALNSPQEAYELLDEEYRNERFGSLENYLEYVEEYKDVIENGVLSKYAVEYDTDYTVYTLEDTYENVYIITETSIMNYTIQLDDYTVKDEDYIETYNSLSDTNKVAANAYIFLRMINTKDYENLYELLNTTFKENNFSTLEEFKEYVNNNFFDYNINNEDENIEEGTGYYIYTTTIKDSNSSAAETKKLTIIIKLLDDIDVEMSFSV